MVPSEFCEWWERRPGWGACRGLFGEPRSAAARLLSELFWELGGVVAAAVVVVVEETPVGVPSRCVPFFLPKRKAIVLSCGS